MNFRIRHLKFRRKIQAIRYAWYDSKVVAEQNKANRMAVYKDMRHYYRLYNCWSNYYREADLWNKPLDEKIAMATKQGELFTMRDKYVQHRFAERAFLNKYTGMKYENAGYFVLL